MTNVDFFKNIFLVFFFYFKGFKKIFFIGTLVDFEKLFFIVSFYLFFNFDNINSRSINDAQSMRFVKDIIPWNTICAQTEF